MARSLGFANSVTGMLVRPGRTLHVWRRANLPAWRVLFGFTIPVLLGSVLLSGVAHEIIPQDAPLKARHLPVPYAVYSGLTQLLGVLAMAAAAHYLCRMYHGASRFGSALAAVSLALVPAWLANVVAALPWPYGAYTALALILYSVGLLYAAFAVVLGVRSGYRFSHLFMTLAFAASVAFVFGWLGAAFLP